MSGRIRMLASRIWGSLRRRSLDDDFDQEMASHLAMAEEDNLRRGMTREEASRAARIELGGLGQLREATREARGVLWLDTLWLDVKLGLRMLHRYWGLTLVGGLALTVAIGPGAIVFVLIETVLGNTLPLDAGDRIVVIQTWDVAGHRRRDTAFEDFRRWSAELGSLEDLGAFQTVQRNMIGGDGTIEPVWIAQMTASGFRTARTAPLLGRVLVEEDERPGSDAVVVIGHDVWQARFSRDPDVVGRTLRIGTTLHTIVGVMPEGFAFPLNHSYWTPLRESERIKAGPEGAVFARLSQDARLETAAAELTTLGLLGSDIHGGEIDGLQPRVVPYDVNFLDDVEPGEVRGAVRLALILVTLLLVPPAANVAVLLYARTVMRREEIETRHALGASRGRIVLQIFIEVLVLAGVAGGIALLLARASLGQLELVVSRELASFGGFPFWWNFDLSFRTVLFVAGLATLAAAIAGIAPALQVTRRLTRSRPRPLIAPLGRWSLLVASQVAMAVAILPSSMEVVWGTFRPVVLGPGFEADEYLTARVLVETETGAGGEIVGEALMARFGELHAELARQLENAPGIFSQVTAAAAVPGEDPLTVIETEEPDGPRRIRRYAFRRNSVDAAFFDVFEVDLLAGRRFAPGDFASGGSVIVVDRTFAAQAFGAENPVGRRIRSVAQAGAPAGGWQEIVGVVSDLPENTSRGAMYAPLSPGRIHPVSLAMRVGPGAAGAANRIREIAADLGPGLRVEEVRTVDEVYRWTQRLANIPVYILAGVTLSVLLLSGAGIYALTSFTVAQRRREIGIRSALGARSGRLLGGILARVLLQVGVGAFIGVLGALLLHHALNLETLGGWHLPGILPAAVTLMCVVGLLAASGPARRALRLEIFETLRDG